MPTVSRYVRVLFITAVVLSLLSAFALAEVHTAAVPQQRVVKTVDNSKRTTLYGHVPRVLQSGLRLERVDPTKSAEHLVLMLKSSPDQQREIRRVLDEQQDKRAGNFHQWMTPDEFGTHFGVHDADIQAVANWLTSQGLTVEGVNKSKRAIHFSGTIGQIEQAFQVEMHYYLMPNGETHVSNDRDITVPEALSPVIAGVPTLNDFFHKSHMQEVGRYSHIRPGPKYTANSSTHYVSPGDFATIYNTAPLLAQGINGTGVTIGVVGRSDILLSDVQTYRQMFGLPPNDPNFIHAGEDQGILPGDDGESDLDVEISGGVAPGATVDFVIGTPTFLVDGITNSVEYLVENNIADIISLSYGDCEANEGAAGNAFNSQMWEQAAAQGTSVFVAAGDNGASGCDDQGSQTYEVLGYATGGEESTWYSVAVGGTEFYGDGGSGYSTYWNTNTNPPFNSALSYIPEYPWNESRVASPAPTGEPGSDLTDLWSGSGGISAYYLRPPWQTGSGIPASDPNLTLGNGATGLWVTGITITNPGSGYTSAPTVTFSGGGCTAEPAATSTISGGQVTGFTFTGYSSHFQGFGCTSAPTIAFSGGGGSGAAATATVGQMQYPQPLVSGVPHRLTPDVSLNASSGHDATFFCSEGVCELNSSGALVDAGLVGGTSVAAPSMAGVQALINQANGGRQGMPGYIYYTLAAAQNSTACNSSTLPGSSTTCAFQDVTLGNNLVCGLSGSSCSATLTSAKMGFNAGTGYDMATGLGSPNAANLASQWSSVVFNSSNVTLGLSQTTFQHGTNVTLSGTVAPGSGSGTPTGDVAFIVSSGAIGDPVDPFSGALNGPVAFATLSSGSYSAVLNNLPGGTYYVTARYGGDENFASSLSTPVQVTVSSEGSGLTITPYALNGSACTITSASTFNYASDILINLGVAGISGAGAPTGTVTLNVDGSPVGTYNLDPNGNAFALSGAVTSSSCIYDYNSANISTIAAGGHTLTASYSGDTTYSASTATPVSITVNQLTPTLTLTPAGGATIASGQSISLTGTFGTLTGINGNSTLSSAPTGIVTFTDTTTSMVLGTASIVSLPVFSGNNYTYQAYATLTTTGITVNGANAITASFAGDTNWAPVTSAAVTFTVATGTSTTTAVTSNGNPTTLGGRPTFTATVTTASAGSVAFYDGSYYLGAGSAVGSAHTSTFRIGTTTPFVGGTHNITAIYQGSGTTLGSVSPALVETVTQGTNSINLTAKTSGTSNQNFTFAAVLTPSSTSSIYAPNQSVVNFFDGATNIGSAQPLTVTSSQDGYGLWTATLTTTLSAGTHTITAQYSDVNYSLATSNSQTVTVAGNTQTITFTTNAPASAGYGSQFTLAATASSGLTVAFTSFGSCTNSGATYTMTKSTGSCLVIANQAGNSNYGPAPEVTQTVSATLGSQTIMCSGVPASAAYGSSFTASCSASSGLAVAYTSSGACTNSGANYTMTSPTGTCSVIANQAGNSNYSPAPQVTNPVTATQAATSLSVTSVSPSSEDYGLDSPTTITAVLSWSGSGSAPTAANVTIGGNGPSGYSSTNCGSPTGNTITCTATYTPTAADTPGSYTETATFSGDTNYTSSSSSQSNNFTINNATSTTSVGSSQNPSNYGDSVTFTATINGEYGLLKKRNAKHPLVTGTVTWSDNTGCGTTPVTSGNPGTATCTTSSLPVGTDTITAAYSGDSNHSGSTGTLSGGQQVMGEATTINVTSVSPSSEDYGQDAQITITAVLSWTGNGAAPTAANVTIGGNGPSGTYGTTGCGPASGHTITCTNTYTPTASDATGSYTETATFSGDSNYNSSSSPQTNNFSIGNATSTTSVGSSENPSQSGDSVTFTATINGEYGLLKKRNAKHPLVTGTVTWSGNTACGTTPVTSGNPGTATCTTSSLPVGNDPITATYSGDSNHGGSQGTLAGGQIVMTSSSVAVGSSVNPSSYGQSVSFSATVTGSSPTGTVQFKIDGTNFGSAVTLVSGTATSGSTSTLPTGTHTVAAVYSGDTFNDSSTGSLAGGQVVNKASQTITCSGIPASAGYGSSFMASCSASSGLAVAYTSAGSCSNTGNMYTMTAPTGHCMVIANQAGNSDYSAAPQVQQSVQAKKGTATATFTGAPATAPYQTQFTVTATINDGATPTITTSAQCSISGNTVTMTTGTGTCTTTAKWPATTDYNMVTLTQHTTASKLTPVITWPTPDPITYGTALSGTQLDASASYNNQTVNGTFTYNPAAGKVLAAGTQTLNVTFKPSVPADYVTVTDSVMLVVNQQPTSTAITKTVPTAPAAGQATKVYVKVTAGYGNPTGTVTVTSDNGGPSCTVSLNTGGGFCSETFGSAGTYNLTGTYNGDSNNQTSTSASFPLTVH